MTISEKSLCHWNRFFQKKYWSLFQILFNIRSQRQKLSYWKEVNVYILRKVNMNDASNTTYYGKKNSGCKNSFSYNGQDAYHWKKQTVKWCYVGKFSFSDKESYLSYCTFRPRISAPLIIIFEKISDPLLLLRPLCSLVLHFFTANACRKKTSALHILKQLYVYSMVNPFIAGGNKSSYILKQTSTVWSWRFV